MTDAQIDYSNVGRNDACPCGSGKKFKACHEPILKLQRQAQAQTVTLDSFIRPRQFPHQWLKGMQMIVNRRDWALFHEAIWEGSPYHQKFPKAEELIELARSSSESVPLTGDYRVRRFHTVDEFAFVMGVRGHEDRLQKQLTYEVMALVNTTLGFRITNVERLAVDKGEEVADPHFNQFACFNEVYEAVQQRPLRRPFLKHWDPEQKKMVVREGAKDTSGPLAGAGALLEGAASAPPMDDLAESAPVVMLGKSS